MIYFFARNLHSVGGSPGPFDGPDTGNPPLRQVDEQRLGTERINAADGVRICAGGLPGQLGLEPRAHDGEVGLQHGLPPQAGVHGGQEKAPDGAPDRTGLRDGRSDFGGRLEVRLPAGQHHPTHVAEIIGPVVSHDGTHQIPGKIGIPALDALEEGQGLGDRLSEQGRGQGDFAAVGPFPASVEERRRREQRQPGAKILLGGRFGHGEVEEDQPCLHGAQPDELGDQDRIVAQAVAERKDQLRRFPRRSDVAFQELQLGQRPQGAGEPQDARDLGHQHGVAFRVVARKQATRPLLGPPDHVERISVLLQPSLGRRPLPGVQLGDRLPRSIEPGRGVRRLDVERERRGIVGSGVFGRRHRRGRDPAGLQDEAFSFQVANRGLIPRRADQIGPRPRRPRTAGPGRPDPGGET